MHPFSDGKLPCAKTAQGIVLHIVFFLYLEAGNEVIGTDLDKSGLFLAAAVLGIRAAGCKAACCGRIDRRRQLALHDDPFLSVLKRGNGNSGKKRLSVGMERFSEEFVRIRLFKHSAQIHYHDIV